MKEKDSEAIMNIRQLGVHIDLLAFSTLLCIIMYIYLKKNNDRNSHSLKLLMRNIVSTAIICCVEIISIIAGTGSSSLHIVIHYISNAIYLTLVALPAAFWLIYLDYKIFGRKTSPTFRYFIYFIPTLLFAIDAFVINTFVLKGYVFSLDAMNTYTRGPAIVIHTIVLYIFMLFAVLNFYRSKNMIYGRISQVILIVVLLPVVGNTLQILFYGITLSSPSYVLAAFITYLILEKDEMRRDPLTGLYTRAYIENRLVHKLSQKEPFSLIMLDLNHFKKINDDYGHSEGDQVLLTVAETLNKNIGIADMVCRYGGDEFIVILEDVHNIGSEKIKLFDQQFAKINQANPRYKIEASYGLFYIDYQIEYSMYELLKIIDQNMYEDKKLRKKKKHDN